MHYAESIPSIFYSNMFKLFCCSWVIEIEASCWCLYGNSFAFVYSNSHKISDFIFQFINPCSISLCMGRSPNIHNFILYSVFSEHTIFCNKFTWRDLYSESRQISHDNRLNRLDYLLSWNLRLFFVMIFSWRAFFAFNPFPVSVMCLFIVLAVVSVDLYSLASL